MDAGYMYACAIVWCRAGEQEAGWELVRGLASGDPQIRQIAAAALCDTGPESLSLIETGLAARKISPEQGALCLLEIMASVSPESLQPAN